VSHLALAAALTAVLVVLALGFRYLGSPANQRAINSDERRLEDLRSIAQWIHARSLALPATLSEPARRSPANLTDPVTHAPYEYRAKSGKDYDYAARSSPPAARMRIRTRRGRLWNHPKGRHCCQLDASQQIVY
jgi:hypothetical protein